MLLHCPQFLQNINTDITPEQLQNLKIKRPPSEYDDGPPCLRIFNKREKLSDGRDRVYVSIHEFMLKKKWPEELAQTNLDIFNHKHFVNIHL